MVGLCDWCILLLRWVGIFRCLRLYDHDVLISGQLLLNVTNIVGKGRQW